MSEIPIAPVASALSIDAPPAATGIIKTIERAFEPAREVLVPILSNPTVLAVWAIIVLLSLGVLWWDLRENNEVIGSMMKFVWTLTVAYSGPLGLAVYWYTGRTQIDYDSLWKRGFRSTSHCYSGCGAGEIVGITLAQGLLGWGLVAVAGVTFALAYLFGFALTIGPLMQDGVGFKEAVTDALWSETPSITLMEIAAIGTDLLLASEALITDVLFWLALAFSLSIGFLVAWPVNVGLVNFGVKEGMSDPSQMD
ncbi:DUF4396 domain-containing protein [Halococcus sediminicola]|uniref:DUF4396 domain-containing protein n=1 Tax=Halococcus sediminicola TaxID=1264579 RepID=UPI0009AE21B0|nr:DUF4396 domain-containing protein [Halococcus sediminicola]